MLCGGGGLIGEYVLHGSPDDPRFVWLTEADGNRRDLVWWPGTSARFTLGLEVIDPSGRIIAHDGSLATGACYPGTNDWLVDFTVQPTPSNDVPDDTSPAR